MKISDTCLIRCAKSAMYLLCLCFSYSIIAQTDTTYDLVISQGRVIDPETELDAIKNIGISNGTIMEISTAPLKGKQLINAAGLVVAPGFIDLHVHGVSNTEQRYQVHDGVTTALELEAGLPFLENWYEARASNALINYGASACWMVSRIQAMNTNKQELSSLKESIGTNSGSDIITMMNPFGKTLYTALDEAEIERMLEHVEGALRAGGIGIGVPVGYLPGASDNEIFELYKLSGETQAPIFTHVKEGGLVAVQQALSMAMTTNAPLHVVHLNSSTLEKIELANTMIVMAHERGFNITTELYPYTAASTELSSPLFDAGWQEKLNMRFEDLQWVATGERLNAESFTRLRKKGGTVIMHMMKDEWINYGVASKNMIIASDGMAYSALGHPRIAGTFSRILGKYVRNENLLSLKDALKKMTLLPAQRLEEFSPMMKLKGRLQVSADADITIFNPDTIIDQATFKDGLKFSEGIEFVIVNGIVILKKGELLDAIFPGKPVYGKFKQ